MKDKEDTTKDSIEEKLRLYESRYHQVFNANPLPSIIYDSETLRLIDVNNIATLHYQYTREEFLNMTIKGIYLPEDLPSFLEHLSEPDSSLDGKPWRHRKKDGSIINVEVTEQPLEFTGNKHRIVIIEDVTEQKKTKEILKLTQFSVDHSAIPTFWFNIKGQVIHVNKATCNALHYTKEELLKMNVRDWDSDFPYDKWKEQWPEFKEKHAIIVESIHRRKDNTEFPVELNINYFQFNGKEYVFAFAHDLTERKLAEKEKEKLQTQLFQSRKMEAVGQLAGSVAHDFNNILTSIIGYGSLLEMEIPENSSLRQYVEQVLSSAEKAADLTQSLLTFSRKQTISLKPCSLNDIIIGVEKLLKKLLMEDITLTINLTERALIIMADIAQIDQAIINLSTNARDAMPNGGTLTMVTKLLTLDAEFANAYGNGKPGEYAFLSISDTGTGMDDTIKEKIFDPFFTTKEIGQGSGLGLSIVYGIIKQHNGFVTVQSKEGDGTTVNLYLPVIDTTSEKHRAAPVQTRKGTETILLAEDNGTVRRLTKEVLERTGYTVIEAIDGEDAIRQFLENKDTIDFLIIDAVMPGKNGKEVYNEIRKIRPHMKALFTSGYTKDIIINKGIYDPSYNFLSKPLSPNELVQRVRELLDQ